MSYYFCKNLKDAIFSPVIKFTFIFSINMKAFNVYIWQKVTLFKIKYTLKKVNDNICLERK